MNAFDETCEIVALAGNEIVGKELELLQRAEELMPSPIGRSWDNVEYNNIKWT